MRRVYVCILIFLMCVCYAIAQNQQGIVKTRGRMVNGQLVAGTRLSGATITLNFGNSLVSGNQGEFSFNVPSRKTYSLVMAEKKGYTLADPEYTRRSFSYSASNPFYVVLEDVNQRQADINAATRKVRRTLMTQLQKREDEIEALKEQNKLTEEDYQKRLQELYDNQSKSEQLVKDMAERYASTDYDQLDEFNRQVQMYIEEGELQKADSMIRSKGDMEKRVEEYHNAVKANKQERQELNQREAQLVQSEAGAAKTYEDLSQDLFRKSEIFLQEFKHDSALHYLKMRANLDTTNVDAVWDYAFLCDIQRKFTDCELYYHICLSEFIQNQDIINIAKIQNNLGALYYFLHDYPNSEKYYQLALVNHEKLFQQNPEIYRANLAVTQNSLGTLYSGLHDYPNSERYYKSALKNYELLFRLNPDAYQIDLASVQNNLGNLYITLHDYPNSEKYYKLALENKEKLLQQNPDAYRAFFAKTTNNLGTLYLFTHDYANSEKYIKSALEDYEQLFHQNPDAYKADLAMTQNNLGTLYRELYNFPISEKYYKYSEENYEQLFHLYPDAYRAGLARTCLNMMLLYTIIDTEEQYTLYLDKNLILFKDLYKLQPTVYGSYVIELQKRKVWQLLGNGEIDDAMKLAEATCARDESNEKSKAYLAECYLNKAYEYANASDFDNAHETIDKAIALVPTNANYYNTKGEILLMQGKNEEASEIWKKVLELNPDFLKIWPDGSNLSNGLKKLGLI